MLRFVLMGVRSLCLACVLAFAPRAFAQAPGIPAAADPASPSTTPLSPPRAPTGVAPAPAPAAVAPVAAPPAVAAPGAAAPTTVAPAPAPTPVTPVEAPPPPPAPVLTRVTLAPPPSAATPAPRKHSGLSPTYFWIAASTTIIVASLGGFEALHVRDLYDQANGLPTVSPVREQLHDDMKAAEVTADALLIGSLALAVGTAILAFHIDWSGGDRATDELARRAPPSTAGRRWW